MMAEIMQEVGSICPECMKRLKGRLVQVGDNVELQKRCPDHGDFSATVWRGEPAFTSWVRPKLPYGGGVREPVDLGCPYDCGLCLNHHQRTCTALVEITSRCNLHCPVCFADSGEESFEPTLAAIHRTLAQVMHRTGGCNLQLSGGEPTMRDDLEVIIAMAADLGFTFIQLNTNGLKLAADAEYAGRLRKAGLSSVFLQFDGVTDAVYRELRGRELFALKCEAVDNAAAAGLGIVLVPTLVGGINSRQLWEIVEFALERLPHVRGVHFQPISYFGRFPAHFTPDHFTLPEIMRALTQGSNGRVQNSDFHPPGCEHALCSFSAKYLVNADGSLQPLGGGDDGCKCAVQSAEEGAFATIAATSRQWRGVLPVCGGETMAEDDLSRFLQHARGNSFQLSAMAFQDCWSLNLERLRGCCIHVAQEDGRLIPFCSYNLTSRSGGNLYRGRGSSPVAGSSVDHLVAGNLCLGKNFGRAELEKAQFSRLRKTVRYAIQHSRYYREKLAGLAVESLVSCSDLEMIPLLHSDELVRYNHLLQCVSQSRVARIVTLQTSGSTGEPKRVLFTANDLAATTEFFYHGMLSLIDHHDRVLVMLPYTQQDSTGELLVKTLTAANVFAEGMWPPQVKADQFLKDKGITCVVGLPQQLLALAERVGPDCLRSMLLCSDYAPFPLRERIEKACGCTTFLHYGTTESGLGGAVECGLHQGCHIRESELLIEIVDPLTGRALGDGELGEIVLTTLGREAMPLIRYRTGDLGRLDRSRCGCGGRAARLFDIRGRMTGCIIGDSILYSHQLDDLLFTISGLLDYRAIVSDAGGDSLLIEYLAGLEGNNIAATIRTQLRQQPVIRTALANGSLSIGDIRQVGNFSVNHTEKRTILDQRV